MFEPIDKMPVGCVISVTMPTSSYVLHLRGIPGKEKEEEQQEKSELENDAKSTKKVDTFNRVGIGSKGGRVKKDRAVKDKG